MNPLENAFNTLFPPALRVVALHQRIQAAAKDQDWDVVDALHDDIKQAHEDLGAAIHCIEAGLLDGSLSCSIASVMQQMKERARHN